MTDARSAILARLKQERRESTTEKGVVVSRVTIEEPIEQFKRGLEKVFATHESVTTKEQVSLAVERYVKQLNEDDELVMATAIRNAGLVNESALKIKPAPTRGNEKNAVTMAYAGIAETGSLVMLSSAETPMTTNFLPDNFICILKTRDVLNDMESVWARMNNEQRAMPRSVNIITGPSRTADVEQIIQMGAHGPRRVHVILWDAKKE